MYSSIHTYSFRRRFAAGEDDFFSAVDWAAEHGFPAMEMMIGNVDKPRLEAGLPDVERETVVKAVSYATRRGVRVTSLSTFNDFGLPNDGARDRHLTMMKGWIQIAAECGVPYLRFLTGYYREGQDPAWQEERTLAGIKEIVSAAVGSGVGLATENHNSIFVSADALVSLAREFGPVLSLCPDPTNWVSNFYQDPQAERELAYTEAAKVAPYAAQSHLKIRGVTKDEGLLDFDVRRLLRIYRDAGYTGPIAFESVTFDDGKPGDLLADLPAARQILERHINEVLHEVEAASLKQS